MVRNARGWTAALALAAGGCCGCPRAELGDVDWGQVESVELLRETYCANGEKNCEETLVDQFAYELDGEDAKVRLKVQGGEERAGSVPSGPTRSFMHARVQEDAFLDRLALGYACQPESRAPAMRDTLYVRLSDVIISMDVTSCDANEEPEIEDVRRMMTNELRGFLDPL